MSVLAYPAHRFVWNGHPQGKVAAPLGAVCINPNTGRRYVKLGPTSPLVTPYGWYRDVHPFLDTYYAGQARGAGGVTATAGVLNNANATSSGVWLGNSNGYPMTLGNGQNILVGRTTGAINTTALLGLGTQGMVGGDTNAGPSGAHDSDVDFAIDVMFGVDISEGTATTLNNARFMIALFQGVGSFNAPANSATLKTAIGAAVSASSAAWGWRYGPTPDGDTGVRAITADGAGQTVSANLATPVYQTLTRYRIRIVHNDPNNGNVNTAYFSINDGVETIQTGNMAVAGGSMLQASVFVYQTAADPNKSIAYLRHFLTAGNLY